jgi:lytic murein transglycosylase
MHTLNTTQAVIRQFLVSAALVLAMAAGHATTPEGGETLVPASEAGSELNREFAAWVDAFKDDARRAGIQEATLKLAFDKVRFVPRAIDRDRAQPEFTRPVWDYLDNALSTLRTSRGQSNLLQIREQVEPLIDRYGVPIEVIVAIWGIESNYGANIGDIPTIDTLATLGFEGRREAWARAQLLAALKMLQSSDIVREQLVGSWAGAMGQTQFLPSNFLAFAVDADGDGRRDLWGSVPDVMASTANFLSRSGWKRGQPWGVEVRLPDVFDVARADADLKQAATAWAAEGVQALDGSVLPAMADASLLLPAGARGPAFLVGSNFRTLLRYNNSSSYALAVSLMAQRLAGGAEVQASWPRDVQL